MTLFLGVVGASSCDARLESVRLECLPAQGGAGYRRPAYRDGLLSRLNDRVCVLEEKE